MPDIKRGNVEEKSNVAWQTIAKEGVTHAVSLHLLDASTVCLLIFQNFRRKKNYNIFFTPLIFPKFWNISPKKKSNIFLFHYSQTWITTTMRRIAVWEDSISQHHESSFRASLKPLEHHDNMIPRGLRKALCREAQTYEAVNGDIFSSAYKKQTKKTIKTKPSPHCWEPNRKPATSDVSR